MLRSLPMTRILALPVFGLFLGFLVLELGVRIFWFPDGLDPRYDTASPVESMRWVAHPFQPYAGRPSATFDLKNDDGTREHIVTNSHGFRTHEFAASKRPDDYVVVCLGGSTTYGFKVDANANTWPERLEAHLAARHPERNVRVYNLGVDMATTVVSLVNMVLYGVRLEPDLVIVYHGYNDLAALGAANFRTDHAHFYADLNPRSVFSYQALSPRWLRHSFAWTVASATLDRMSGSNDLAQAVQMPRTDHADPWFGIESMFVNLDSIHALAASGGGQTLFSTFQFRDGALDPRLGEFNDALRSFFARRGYDYVDQDALLPDLDPTINVDPCHFTQEGRERMARNYFDHIVARDLVTSVPPRESRMSAGRSEVHEDR